MSKLELFKEFCENSLRAKDVDPAMGYMNYIVDRMEFNEEQVLWLCFLYAVTYQLPSAYLIWNEYPDLELVGIARFRKWWDKNQQQIPFQTDKIKQRRSVVETVESYKNLVGKSQKAYFDSLLNSKNPQENFDRLWDINGIKYFGRFSIWNWCQALKHVAGYTIEPTTLMIGESESVSFTDGLAYAYGHLDRVTTKEAGKKVYHNWTDKQKAKMEKQCADLKEILGIDNFALETLACAFKKIWRENDSRYIGYYNDRIAEDIRNTARNWSGVDWKLLWDARDACVPKHWRNDKGVNKSYYKLSPQQKVRTSANGKFIPRRAT